MAIADYNTDPDLNVDISGINIAEGCPPSGINNAIRQMMADVKTFTDSPTFSGGITVTSGATISGGISADTLTVTSGATISGGMTVSGTISGTCTSATNATSAGTCTGNAATATNASSLGGVAANGYVKTSSDQTIGGKKTFTASPITTAAYIIKTGLTLGTAGSDNSYFSYTDKNVAKSLGNMQFHATSTWYALRLMLRKITDTSTSDSSLASVGFSVSNSNVYSFQPFQSGTTLGANSSSSRWGQIYSSSTTISTSDERAKTDIEDVPDSVLDAWGEVNWKQFKMRDAVAEKGVNARLHNGLIAQRIDEVFKAHGQDASRYGLFCYDEWDATPEEKDEHGNVTEEGRPAGNIYSLRYEEALSMEAAYQRRRADRAEARLADIERRLAALEAAE